MALNELAGKKAPREILENIPRLVTTYFSVEPDPSNPAQRVAFGTSGHRGSAFDGSFNEAHVLAITQALAEHRAAAGIDGPLFIGIDTHALSEPALVTTVEVLAANGALVVLEQGLRYTPTPVVSHAILGHNRGRTSGLGDGVVITPSHNPPRDGGYKYNPPSGGPADEKTTKAIEARANAIIAGGLRDVKRIPWERARRAPTTRECDNLKPYVDDLRNVVEVDVIRSAGLKLGVHPLGGASVSVWGPIAETYGLDIEIVDPRVDPTFSFMTVDHDGKIRMDCSSPYAMASLVELKDRFDLAFGNDGDADRHGIVSRGAGLLPPNHVLAVAIRSLFETRKRWPATVGVGKTLVSSSMIDRVAKLVGRPLAEVPVGFKWFVDGLTDGTLGFGGEESAGATFLRLDGSVWTTDKDGPIIDLLAAEITARTGRDPAESYRELEERFGSPVYERTDAPASPAQKAALAKLEPEQVTERELAGEPILAKMTRAPANGAPIGGIKVVTENGWFAARPSGTENIYKIYAESFRGRDHLARIQAEAQALVDGVLAKAARA
ncbi:MAG: alpha-D-glucose phosphate-specific phosphoglucomutase [Deltaproteobacteria bacterium]|nr:alpha-D-glucose phosphate-specific phosphoglucomutase [Deltaproteobacteria bacterium]